MLWVSVRNDARYDDKGDGPEPFNNLSGRRAASYARSRMRDTGTSWELREPVAAKRIAIPLHCRTSD